MNPRPTLTEVVVKTAVAHSTTYFVAGLVASNVFDYAGLFAEPGLDHLMRPIGDRWVMAGPLFQPVRGAVFGLVVWALRDVVLAPRGWLTLWAVLVAVGIFGTFGPSPGSLEGLVYTRLALPTHLRGLPEVLTQSLALSVLVHTWVTTPRRWLSVVLAVGMALVVALPTLGLLLAA